MNGLRMFSKLAVPNACIDIEATPELPPRQRSKRYDGVETPTSFSPPRSRNTLSAFWCSTSACRSALVNVGGVGSVVHNTLGRL